MLQSVINMTALNVCIRIMKGKKMKALQLIRQAHHSKTASLFQGNNIGEIAKAVNKYSVAENNVIGGGNMGFLLMHDLNYGLEDITVQNNFVDTSKKFINSYKLDKNVRWSSHSKRNLVVRNNYTSLNSKWKENREMIIENAGRRSK